MPRSPATTLQQHQAVLAEYDALLASLSNAKTTASPLSNYVYEPVAQSPLQVAHADALEALASVLHNPVYVAALTQRDLAPDYLEVSIAADRVTYTSYYLDGSPVRLVPEEFPQLVNLLRPVERAARTIGGYLCSDPLLPISVALKFYDVPPALLDDTGAPDALIAFLEEARAIHHLRLGTCVDIGRLFTADDHARVLDAVSELLAQGQTSAIASLAAQALPGVTVEQVRASPMSSLDRLLNGSKAQALAARLTQSLDWYGAVLDEQPPAEIAPHLVAEALRLWYCDSFDDPADSLFGFRLDTPEHWGKSYQAIRRDFEKHLSACGMIAETDTDTLEEVMLGHLLLSKYASDFAVPDIPPDLPYASSIAWVNFAHGVNLAQALEPGLLQRLAFQQLIDLPLRQSENASDQMLQLIALTRLEPAQRWAAATGNVYPVSISEALSTLDSSTLEMNQAIRQLGAQPQHRLDIARAVIDRGFFPTKCPKVCGSQKPSRAEASAQSSTCPTLNPTPMNLPRSTPEAGSTIARNGQSSSMASDVQTGWF